MKIVISSRYYPEYYNRRNTYWSYRSYRVGKCITHRDYVVGHCDDDVPDGWIVGVRGGYAARTGEALNLIPGYTKI
jgi:hypothetical protein